jgi:TolB-like protein/Flp pilus assembly protein TadD
MAVPDDLERVAVLPFRDLSPGADDHHLARGISDEVVHRLATIPALAVISSTSSYRYRDAAPEVAARELHAGILVTGSLRREEDQLRVRVEVAETKGGTQLWSGSFDGHTTSVFALQEQIGRAVARVVAVDLPTPAPTAERERNALAYEISLRGRAAAFERERAHQERAVEFYRRALEIDPEDADTYTALAQAERELSYVPGAGAGRHLDNATLAIERALRLAPDDARALTADGAIRMKRREWRRAEQSLRRALALERSAAPHLLLGHLFIMTDRLEAARDQLERARRLDPMSPILERTAGRLHLYLGEYDEAIARLRRALELSPHDPDAPRLLAESLYRNGDEQRAGEVLIRIAPRWLRVAFRIDHRIEGPTQSLRHLLAFDIWRTGRACREDPQGTALMWAFLGEPDEMLACLEVTEPQELAYSWVEPAMRPYREDPRFRKIMRKGGYGPVIDGEFAPSAAQNSIRPPTVRLRSP